MSTRPSKAKALRAYFLEQSGYHINKGVSDVNLSELRREARETYRESVAAAAGGRVAVIRRICTACVGGDADGPPPRLIRECSIFDCRLYPVRPHQMKSGSEGQKSI